MLSDSGGLYVADVADELISRTARHGRKVAQRSRARRWLRVRINPGLTHCCLGGKLGAPVVQIFQAGSGVVDDDFLVLFQEAVF